MFDLFETEFIRNPIILACLNDSIGRKKIVAIPIFKMVLICYNDKQRHRPTTRIDALDYNDPFPIAKLYSFNFFTPVVRCYNKDRCNLAYKKACLVEILDVGLYNIIFGNYILEKSKSNPNNLQIFILNLLIIVQTVPIYIELQLSFDEVGNPMQSDIYRVVYRQQSVGYIFYIVYPGRKYLQVQIKYFSYDYFFFQRGQFS